MPMSSPRNVYHFFVVGVVDVILNNFINNMVDFLTPVRDISRMKIYRPTKWKNLSAFPIRRVNVIIKSYKIIKIILTYI